MFDNLIKNDDKKSVEPFNLAGRRSLIYSKKEAAKILKDNSYYFFVAAALPLSASIFAGSIDIGVSQKFLIGFFIDAKDEMTNHNTTMHLSMKQGP